MYNSIISGLQETIDNLVDQSKHDRIDLDSLPFNDVPPSTEDALVDIIPIDWSDTESEKRITYNAQD
jgi:hypothetical protein